MTQLIPHQVVQWKWNTLFDDSKKAHTLQTRLSEWSQSTLRHTLNRVLDQYGPVSSVWWLEKVELDLGSFRYEGLEKELPLRFHRCLERHLQQLLFKHPFPQSSDQVFIKPQQSQWETMRHFLVYGTPPWWWTSRVSIKALISNLLLEHPESVAALLREIGKSEEVRKRLVWQLGEDLVKQIIRVLEPYHCKTILAFAEHLQEVQEQQFKAPTPLHQHRWLWILQHLLTERGTLFNTVFFVRQTLRRMADHYQLNFEFLLHTVTVAALEVHDDTPSLPSFLQAILEIRKTTLFPKEASESLERQATAQSLNYWDLLEQMLCQGLSRKSFGGEWATPQELFTNLANQSPSIMVKFLKRVGRQVRAREQMVDQWTPAQLEHVVQLVIPNDHSWIITHIQQTTGVLKFNVKNLSPRQYQKIVWRVVLAYLLENHGSYFNRKSFVHYTLTQISQSTGMGYYDLLQLISLGASPNQGIFHHAELLSIVQDLLKSTTKAPQSDTDASWQVLQNFLVRGNGTLVRETPFESSVPVLFARLLRGDPILFKDHLLQAYQHEPIQVVRRLLSIIDYRDIPRLLRYWIAHLTDLAMTFITRFHSWNAKRPLNCLQGLDLFTALVEALLHILWHDPFKQHTAQTLVASWMQYLSKKHVSYPLIWDLEIGTRLRTETKPDLLTQWMVKAIHPDSKRAYSPPSPAETDVVFQPEWKDDSQWLSVALAWLTTGAPPSNISGLSRLSLEIFIQTLLHRHPQLFVRLVREVRSQSKPMARLYSLVGFEALLQVLSTVTPERHSTVSLIKDLYHRVAYWKLSGVDLWSVRQALLELLLENWAKGTWEKLSPEHLWEELVWNLTRYHQIPLASLQRAIEEKPEWLPVNLPLVVSAPIKTPPPSKAPHRPGKSSKQPLSKALPVNNAGLVLLQGYLPIYLEHLNLVQDRAFCSPEDQRRAVHYLQLLVTGQTKTEEPYLLLNKLLCGLPLSAPIEAGIEPSPEEMDLAKSLIQAVIGHWTAIGSSSVEGFRGNWLVRNGTLGERKNRWELAVEKRAYDLLLNKAPFSFSIVKFAWMEQSLHVNWTF